METTIEEIGGNRYTVVWHKPKGWAESLDSDVKPIYLANGVVILLATCLGTHIATALPALPREPKNIDEDDLFVLACAYGEMRILVDGKGPTEVVGHATARKTYNIEGATDLQGNRVEVAIDNRSLVEVIRDLRSTKGGGWEKIADPWKELDDLRG